MKIIRAIDFSILTSVIIGLAEIIKKFKLNIKFIPIINIILGIAGGIIYLHPKDIKLGIFYGIIAGLTASGLFSSTKNVIEGIKEYKS